MPDACLTRPTSRREAIVPDLWWKRPTDLLLGSLALLVALPLVLCLAIVVVLDDAGPAFFSQARVGVGGRPFRMWKLRTMRAGCEQDTHRLTAADWFTGRCTGDRYKTLADPRITRAGRLLRRCDLDELPQLFNVLLGDMSLVGPRPAIPYELDHYEPAYFSRFSVPPGITGLWQVSGRDRLSAAEMMELDLRYVREASPWLDLRVLLRTGPALLAAARRA
ncbi:MAG TPA: sugar transferase [Candidatus Dormibacteraeota bacterium]|nr:sugar transferase [Candidatus Dormibacteraeota bacterium]